MHAHVYSMWGTVKEEEAYKVKFSGRGLEAVESESEGDGGILHF